MTGPSRFTSIVVADDHPVVLHGITELLRAERDFKIVAMCHDGLSAISAIRTSRPDVAVLDIAMPGKTGLEVLTTIVSSGIATKVIFLTATVTNSQILTAIARGVKGVMLKDTAPQDLISCVRAIAAGREWLPPEIVDKAIEHESGRRLQRELIEDGLTDREREVMCLVAEGLANKEVGRRLGVSEGTVKIHLHKIYEKLGVANRTALAAVAIAHRDDFNS
jgi:two-component system, NarL family, nitrate/nitrite response regulator NarL